MKPKSSKAKGNLLEDFVVERLRKTGLDPRAYRQKGSGSGLNKGDVWNALDIHFECKNVQKMNWAETWRQIRKDNVGNQMEALVWHRPNTPMEDSQVCIPWSDFEDLLLARQDEAPKLEDKGNLRFLIPQGREILRKILKELENE